MSTLTTEKIAELLKGQRTRGDYEVILKDFLNSGEVGVEVPLDSGPLAGKTADQAKIGLDNARKRRDNNGQPVVPGGDAVKVVKVGKDPSKLKEGETAEPQHVYLIDTRKVASEDNGSQQEQ